LEEVLRRTRHKIINDIKNKVMDTFFIEVQVTRQAGESEPTIINVANINYVRRWAESHGDDKAVIYFRGTDKYLVVDESYEKLLDKLS
jgi:hypothetical protein